MGRPGPREHLLVAGVEEAMVIRLSRLAAAAVGAYMFVGCAYPPEILKMYAERGPVLVQQLANARQKPTLHSFTLTKYVKIGGSKF